MNLIPTVIEKSNNGERAYDLYSRLLQDRIIMLSGEIDDNLSFEITIDGEDIPLDIVYEDDYLLIINKASGMVVHPAPGNYSGTMVNALIHKFELSEKDTIRPGIVHRIDADTSGLLVVAKNDMVHNDLAKQISEKTVLRKYIALVQGVIVEDSATIDAPIGRDKNDRKNRRNFKKRGTSDSFTK